MQMDKNKITETKDAKMLGLKRRVCYEKWKEKERNKKGRK